MSDLSKESSTFVNEGLKDASEFFKLSYLSFDILSR